MLLLSIPNGVLEGDCRINGQPCEFKIEGDRLSFRPKEGGDFDSRKILHSERREELTTYFCTSAEPEQDDFLMIRPGKDGKAETIRLNG